jgi:hypothetical protein
MGSPLGGAHLGWAAFELIKSCFININSLINIDYFIIEFPVVPKLLSEHSDQLSDLR